MRDSDQDRIANQEAFQALAKERMINAWLNANPEIGRLNGDKFYKTENGMIVSVELPTQEELAQDYIQAYEAYWSEARRGGQGDDEYKRAHRCKLACYAAGLTKEDLEEAKDTWRRG